jgi:glycosyltransferase involved in cell wall biosynthesis
VQQAARLLRERAIDVVDGRGDTGTVVAALAARLAGTRAVVSTNYFPQVKHAGPRSPAWHLFRGVYGLVDAVVCDSQTCLDAMRRWMLFAPPGRCIPNGIAPPRATRPAQEVAAELGIPDGARVIGQIARIQPYKGQELLLAAAARVLAEVPDAFVLLCGYPSYNQEGLDHRDRLVRAIAAAGLGKRVRLAPYPGPIGDVWPLVDIHAHPTLLDSSPIALLEGMSLGKPAVTTRVGGIHELVRDGETGIVLPPGDAGPLADALLRLLHRPEEAVRLGRNARARHRTGYTPQVMARRIEDLFEEVHGAPRGRVAQAA